MRLGAHRSRVFPAPRGVPPAGILSRLVFSVYNNDIMNINRTATFIIYGGVVTILRTGQDGNTIATKCNSVPSKLSSSSQASQIAINARQEKKTTIYISTNPQGAVTVEGKHIDIFESHKILAVISYIN